MLVPLVLLFLFVVVALFVFLVPALVDFVRRDDRVGWWFALPFLLVFPGILFVLFVFLSEGRPRPRALAVIDAWFWIHLMTAGLFLAQGVGLATSRGLRPGGFTLRRRRTSLAAIALCTLLLFVPWLPGLGIIFAWMLPMCAAGTFWVVALNRRGPIRLERGKEVSGAMFVGAALQLCFACVYYTLSADIDRPKIYDFLIEMWFPLGLVLFGAVAGTRFLAGPIPTFLPFVSLASGLSLAPSMWCWLALPNLPASTPLPEWVDLAGQRGPSLRIAPALDCAWRSDDVLPPPCSIYFYGLADGETPLSEVPADVQLFIVRHRGLRMVGHSWRAQGPLRLSEREGRVVIAERTSHHPVRMRVPWEVEADEGGPEEVLSFHELHARLQREPNRSLIVTRTPNWTVQQFVSMCASMGIEPECRLENKEIPH